MMFLICSGRVATDLRSVGGIGPRAMQAADGPGRAASSVFCLISVLFHGKEVEDHAIALGHLHFCSTW